MDLSILDWFIVIVGMLVLVVLLDGYRRAQRSRRNQVRLSKNAKRLSKLNKDDDSFTSELPNGGARVVTGSPSVNVDTIDSGLTAQDDFTVHPNMPNTDDITDSSYSAENDTSISAHTKNQVENDHSDTDTDDIDPLFADPFKAKSTSEVKVEYKSEPSIESDEKPVTQETLLVEPITTANDIEREEFQPCLFESSQDSKAGQEPIEEIIVLNVLATTPEGFAGADLLHILLACDCRFGDMNIFHRYEQANEKGPVQFSIVNMVKPGTFNLQDINDFSTPGVSFFVQLPGPVDSIQAFDAMVDTAKCLARNLNGELKDEAHSTATEQTIEHCRERIRAYQKKRLVRA